MSRPIDIVVAGLGNPEPEYATTRHNGCVSNNSLNVCRLVIFFSATSTNLLILTFNMLLFLAGYIFIDYLANAIALSQGQSTKNPPRFYRRFDLSGTIYSLT